MHFGGTNNCMAKEIRNSISLSRSHCSPTQPGWPCWLFVKHFEFDSNENSYRVDGDLKETTNVLIANLFMALTSHYTDASHFDDDKRSGRENGGCLLSRLIWIFSLSSVPETNFKEESLCITWLRELRFIGGGVARLAVLVDQMQSAISCDSLSAPNIAQSSRRQQQVIENERINWVTHCILTFD